MIQYSKIIFQNTQPFPLLIRSIGRSTSTGKLWINRRELTARDFSPDEGFQSGGILCVFPALETAQLGKKIRTGNQADADDAVQDTYLRYCSYDKEFTDEDHIRAWLLRVAINRARDQKRSFWEKHRVSWEDYMETLVFEAPEDKSLFEAVMSLPAKYRTVIHLFYYEDYSVARIAEILHSREGTVKSQLNRGRQLLKTKLMEAWNDDE